MLRDIILINSKPIPNIKTLVVNKIEYVPIKKALIESHINPKHPSKSIDALIFTSKNAIKSLAKEIDNNPEMQEFLTIPCYVISSVSAHTLQKYNFNIEFIGNDSYGDGFAGEIIPLLINKTPLYFRAKKIISHLDEKLLEAKIHLRQIVAYENKTLNLDSNLKPPPRSIIIFTAPSHYYSFIHNFGWDGSYIAIAIGMTTFGIFHSEVEGFVSPKPSISDCLEFAKELATKIP